MAVLFSNPSMGVLNKALAVSSTAVQLYWEPLDSLVVVWALSR